MPNPYKDMDNIWQIAAHDLLKMSKTEMREKLQESAGTLDNQKIYEAALEKEYYEVCQIIRDLKPTK